MKKLPALIFIAMAVFTAKSQNKFPTTGNAGVGTATPSVPFEIANTLTQGANVFKFGNPQQYNQIIFRDRSNATFMFGLESSQIKIGFAGSDHKIMSTQYNAQNIEFWPTLSLNSPSNILINAGQNVGVGKTNPAYKLDVNGPVNASQYFINGSPVTGFTNLWLATPSNTNNIYYGTGNVGIGTNAPTVPLQIGTTLAQGAPVFNFGNAQQYNQIIFRDRSNATFMYGIESSQLKIGFAGNDHKIMSTQYNAQNIEFWPTLSLNSPSNILLNAGQNVGIGTTNPQAKLDVNGTLNATQYLINGSPMAALSGTGNVLYLPSGANLGIGTTNPQARLDVGGDAHVSGNLVVGGGIITTQTVNAAIKINAGDIDVSSNLVVTGNSTFNSGLKLATLAGSGNHAVYSDPNGNLIIGDPIVINTNNTPCVAGASNWHQGGDILGINFNNANQIGTCDGFDFVLKSANTPRQWIQPDGTISFGANITSNTGGAEYKFHQGALRLTGNNTFGGPMMVFGGATSPYGDWGIEYAAASLAKPGLNFWKPFGSTYSNNNIFFLADDGTIGMGTDNPTSRLTMDAWSGDGLRVISGVNSTKAISLNYKNGTTVTENFRVNGDGTTWIGNNVSSVGNAMFVVGQPSATNKILSLVNNGNPNPAIINDVFNVYGNGYTEIKVYNPLTMPSPGPTGAGRAFAIVDMSANPNKDIFVVKADGKTYAREVEISLATTFPDYVFANDYKLKSISEVSDFIKANKHLPGFEKGEYYEKNGLNVNNMLVKQQEKMEEMMLYIIELEKRLKVIEEKK